MVHLCFGFILISTGRSHNDALTSIRSKYYRNISHSPRLSTGTTASTLHDLLQYLTHQNEAGTHPESNSC